MDAARVAGSSRPATSLPWLDMADVSAEAEKRLRAAFAVFDVDGSGSLSVEELRVVLSRPTPGGSPMSDEEIQALIDEFDEDGDGEMQYEEVLPIFEPCPDPEEARRVPLPLLCVHSLPRCGARWLLRTAACLRTASRWQIRRR